MSYDTNRHRNADGNLRKASHHLTVTGNNNHFHVQPSLKNIQMNRTVKELEGFTRLGMKGDALQLARASLKAQSIPGELFCASMEAILALATTRKRWRRLIEPAHQRLSQRGKRRARFLMLCFYALLNDNQAAERFLPRRCAGQLWLADLSFAIQTKLALGKLKEVRPLVRRAENSLDLLDDGPGRNLLISCIAAYLLRIRSWEAAIHLYESLQNDEYDSAAATIRLVETHLKRAHLAIHSGRAALKQLKHKRDGELGLALSYDDADEWQEAEATLTKLERPITRILKAQGCNVEPS
jgi:hypothetical protein